MRAQMATVKSQVKLKKVIMLQKVQITHRHAREAPMALINIINQLMGAITQKAHTGRARIKPLAKAIVSRFQNDY